MIENAELIFGPPGTGKTYTLMQEVEQALRRGIAPDRIGYVSFTKKAIQEAIERACSQFNLDERHLPWFRTLHSWGFNGIGISSDDMMGSDDWAVMSSAVGMPFKGQKAVRPDDGILRQDTDLEKGDRYIRLIDRARYRRISIAQEFNETEDWGLDWNILMRINKEYSLYKAKMKKFDFVDQIEAYIKKGMPPNLEILIVDEAQDLTPLQWEMVKVIAPHADRVIIAGDDDQAVHRWTGVDVNLFLGSAKNVRVLKQSYRMPLKVHALSQRLVRLISTRMEKEFRPTDEEGRVMYHSDRSHIPLDRGSWTLMARTNNRIRLWAEDLYNAGFLYSMKGRSSVDQTCASTMQVWQALQRGEGVELGRIQKFYAHVRKQGDGAVVKRGAAGLLQAASPEAFLTYDQLCSQYGLIADRDRDPYEVARFGEDDRRYIEGLIRRGEDITATPRIKLSTFHSMKGGEDDNCVVSTAIPRQCDPRITKHPDDEHRCFYVGVTRSKKSLHILDDTSLRYEELDP